MRSVETDLALNWLNYRMIKEDGYGRFGVHFVRALARAGVRVTPGLMSMLEMPGDLLRMTALDFSRLTIALMPPHELKAVPGRLINFTMYECTRLRKGWIDQINNLCERVIVPAPWLLEVLDSHDCAVPMHAVPGGIDPHEFPVVHRNGNRPYTFLALGDRGTRKGWDIVWQAFYKAFGDDTRDVRLVVKSRSGGIRWGNGDSRVWIDFSNTRDTRLSAWSDDADTMLDVYAQTDCFVFPTRAEGWGLPPREAAATGLPVLAPRHTGTEIGLDDWAIPLEKYTWRNVPKAMMAEPYPDGRYAQWATCDVDEVADKMRWCYENQDDARALGLKAAQWLRDHQTWDHAARALIDLLDGRYAEPESEA